MAGNTALFVRPSFDLVTQILNSKFSPEVIDYARARLYSVVDLYGDKANKTDLLGALLRYFPQTVFAYSHGTEDEIVGPDATSSVIDLGNTVWFTGGKIMVLNACLSGQRLAQALIDAGAGAVFAYKDTLDIRVWSDTLEPLEGFRECINKPKIIFDGVKAKDVYEATVAEYNKWIEYWDEKDPVTADILRHDRDAFTLYGNGESKITFSVYLLMGFTDTFIIAYTALWALLNVIRETEFLWRKG